MKYKIAHDARPQVRTLVFATLIAVALWFISFASVLAYPFKIFVTFIHEGGHALAALLTGNSVASLSVAMDTSGETYTTTGGLISQLLISSSGYLGAMAFGALLLFLIRRRVRASIILGATAFLVLTLTVIFGFFSPLLHGQPFSPFTIVSGAAIVAGLLAGARYLSARGANFLVAFLAVQCVLNALYDLKSLFLLSTPFSAARTDAMNMANATGVPPLIWALLWSTIAFVILSFALRLYAVSRKDQPYQADLPFEDSTESSI